MANDRSMIFQNLTIFWNQKGRRKPQENIEMLDAINDIPSR
jgi:hypothetical protein